MASILLIIILGFLFMTPSATAIGLVCSKSGNYTANSTYRTNLAFLIRTLSINTSSSAQLFANGSNGQFPNAVHALALCRGDITSNFTGCSACIAGAFRYAQKVCRSDKGAAIYDDYCLLRFAASDFLAGRPNITENATFFQYWNSVKIAGDTGLVAAYVRDMLNQTAQLAASDASRRFAKAFMDPGSDGPTLPTLYSMAQCTPDLSAGDCLECLRRIIGVVNDTTLVSIGGRVLVMRCNFRFEKDIFFDGASMKRITPSSTAAPSPLPAAPAAKIGLGSKPWAIALLVASPLAVAALCFIFYFRCWRRRYGKGKVRLQAKKRISNLLGQDEQDWGEAEADLSEFSVFSFNQILEATGNFSEENKLGEGGFGPVYKGQFPEGMEIAVKRLASHSGQGFLEFKNEVKLIAKLQHANLVRLLGCCSQGEEKILVYEFLPNKSLDFFIFDDNRKSSLDWNKRLVIIEGIAEGLLYLHKHSRLRVIHRDLKPSNILLDSEMNPKISDFGLAKIFSSTEADTTRRVVGTYGYMAPEYSSEGLFSIKSDVFSFGVLVLEILSGKRNSGSHQCGDFINLLGYAWQLHEEGRWDEVIDTSLLPERDSVEMIRCMSIALLCVQENAADRPTMLYVVAMLSNKTMTLSEPKHPAYFNLRVGNEEGSTGTDQSCSINDVTISAMTAR